MMSQSWLGHDEGAHHQVQTIKLVTWSRHSIIFSAYVLESSIPVILYIDPKQFAIEYILSLYVSDISLE